MKSKKQTKAKSTNHIRLGLLGLWLVILVAGGLLTRRQINQAIASQIDTLLNPITQVQLITDDQGYGQIIYTSASGQEFQLTDTRHPKAAPLIWRDQILWLGQPGSTWQVYAYSTTTNQTTQLTNLGNQANLVVATDFVAWEGQVKGVWQVFVYDGWRVTQITNETAPSSELVAGESKLAFVRRSPTDGGQIMLYDHSDQSLAVVTPDFVGLQPEFVANKIRWTTPTSFGSTFFDRDLDTGLVVASETVAELDLLIEMTREASVAASLKDYGQLDDRGLLQSLINLGIVDPQGRVVK